MRNRQVPFTEHPYTYVERGGAQESARQLGVDPHYVVKTLIMEDEKAQPLMVLMHGDCEVSTKELARQTQRKRIHPCKPDVAQRHSGYFVGGTSPFGTRRTMPVYVEASIVVLPSIYVNGGRRGYLLQLEPLWLTSLLQAVPVTVCLPVH